METYSTSFLQTMRRLTRWFNRRKDFTTEQLDLWYDRIGRIPSPILSQIIDQVIDSNKFMPTPGEIKKLYGEFKRLHPAGFLSTDQPMEDCEFCGGEGEIVAWKITPAFNYEYALACGHCNNWRRVFPTRPSGPPAYIMPPRLMRVDDILRDGFVLEDPDKHIKPGTHNEYGTIDEMAQAVGAEHQQSGIPF